ncbi:MFS transporter [Bordetella genomosp. 11]|uniref:MFS transporter n=1 Tax=Bordetella genomosp. 11 TaxID=1416808 RepID=A0A261UNK9_9BORD|nr:MFS transporter [Bordetella genomosp. 11]OZI63484.1 MFS transporter [Bordetella genomosp. 11]
MPELTSSVSVAPEPRVRYLPLITLAMGFVMATLDVTVVNVALSNIAGQLQVPLSGLVWVVDGYTLTFAAMLLVGGGLADRFGAKNVYQTGLAVFVLASLLCGAAANGTTLVIARFLQGLGAALFMPSSLSLLTRAYPDDRVRARMLGLWSAIVSVAGVSGPLVGGILIDRFGWRSIFLVNLPIGLIGLAMAQNIIPRSVRHSRALNAPSHLLGVTALAGLSFTLIEGPVHGWTSLPILCGASVMLVAAAAFVQRERSIATPLLPRELFRTARFPAANMLGFLINFGGYGQLFLLSLFLQEARGATPLTAGMQLLPTMMLFTLGNLSAPRLVVRFGPRAALMGSMTLCATASAATAWILRPETDYWLFAAIVSLINLGVGIAVPAMTAVVMQISGQSHANIAAACLNANRQIGVLVGVAVMGTILHAYADWHISLVLAFGTMGTLYGIGTALVWRYIHTDGAKR